MLKRLIAAAGQNEDQPSHPPVGATSSSHLQPLPSIIETPSAPQHDKATTDTSSVSVTSSRLTQSKPARSSSPSTKGPTLAGLLASKRLAKQLSSRVLRKRYGSVPGSSRLSQVVTVQKEPTYRMEPHKKFQAEKVEECIRNILEDKLQRFPYNPKFCANMSRVLSDDIKKKVKAMNFDRYKIVCSVMIGQRKQQGIHVTSRCAWDEKLDNFASYTFKNENIICTAMVFGVYNE